MILTIDAGNSRIKWALWQNDVITESGAALYNRASVSRSLEKVFDSVSRPDHVYAVSVAGEAVSRAISDEVARRWQLPTGFLKTQDHYREVRQAYPEPSQHGADRWAAVVAAHYMFPRAGLCVIGAGTAITLDFIEAGGRHRGGYILPSPASMWRALTADTANVVSEAEPVVGITDSGNPVLQRIPDNTRDGVSAGIQLAVLAGIREMCRNGLAETCAGSSQTGDSNDEADRAIEKKIIISGGLAQSMQQYESHWREGWPDMPEIIYCPDIVMQGLYRIMTQPDTGNGRAGR
ncbi:MAG TPA: type III pantothenate kinase [Gammaproteobacteria bacterium]|nr:type III pantothenate kinase [Gammaproteobacteria bacterium]